MSLQTRLAESLDKVSWHGHYFSACCVFHHNVNTPALLVYPDRYYCKSCGASGTLAYLDKRLHGVTAKGRVHKDAPQILPRWKRWQAKFEDVAELCAFAHSNLKRFKDDRYFFKQRKIDQFIDEGFFGSLEGWLVFPVFDRERKIVDAVIRAGPSKSKDVRYAVYPIAESNANSLYVPNWSAVLKADKIFIVYGIIDSWTLYSIDLPVITGITGKSLSAENIKPLNKMSMIIPDRYEEKDAHKLARDLGWSAEVVRVKWPDSCKDTDDIRVKLGTSKLKKIILENN